MTNRMLTDCNHNTLNLVSLPNQGYFDTARLELAEHNIHVQTVLPGPVRSNISLYAFTENINVVRQLTGLERCLPYAI